MPAVSEAILLLSDGAQNTGTDPLSVLDDLKARGVRVYAVAIGADADAILLRQLAEETGGQVSIRLDGGGHRRGCRSRSTADLRAVGRSRRSTAGSAARENTSRSPSTRSPRRSRSSCSGTRDCDMTLTSPSGDVIDLNSAEYRDDVEGSLDGSLLNCGWPVRNWEPGPPTSPHRHRTRSDSV